MALLGHLDYVKITYSYSPITNNTATGCVYYTKRFAHLNNGKYKSELELRMAINAQIITHGCTLVGDYTPKP